MSHNLPPSNWVRRRLGDLGDIVTGNTPSTANPANYGGEVPFVSPANLDGARWLSGGVSTLSRAGARRARVLPAGAVLVSCIGILGKVGQASIPVATNQQINAVIADTGSVDPHFLFHAAQRLKTTMERLAGLQVLPIVKKSLFASMALQLPPLPEQRQIAAILDTIDDAIRRTEQIIAKLKQVKQGLLHDLLTRGIDDNGELRDPERHPEQFKDSPIGRIPKGWGLHPLAEVVSTAPYAIVDGPFGSNLKTIHYRASGIPVIQSGYVTSGRFRADVYYYVTRRHFEEQKRSRVDPGDIVMAKIGAQAGMCACLPDEHQYGILAGNSLKISAEETTLKRAWLLAFLHRAYVSGGMKDLRTETAQPAISLARLRSLLIPVPPMREQVPTCNALAALRGRLECEEEELRKARLLKQGLMEDLLTGRVRVTNLLESAAE